MLLQNWQYYKKRNKLLKGNYKLTKIHKTDSYKITSKIINIKSINVSINF